MNKFFIDESVFDNLGNMAESNITFTTHRGTCEFRDFNEKKYLVLLLDKDVLPDKLNVVGNSDKNVLLSLISVLDEPERWNWEHTETYFSVKKVKQWCKTYGLPAIDFDILERYQEYSVSYDTFCLNTSALYLLFRLWQAIKNESLEEIDRYSGILFEFPRLDKSTQSYKNQKKYYYSDPGLEHRKAHAALFYGLINRHLRNIALRISPEGTHLYLETESVFDLCFFHLANMITKGEKEGRNIKVCAGCGNWFSGHANRKYCPECDRRTEYSRRKRQQL